jgi:hypothetical protein
MEHATMHPEISSRILGRLTATMTLLLIPSFCAQTGAA